MNLLQFMYGNESVKEELSSKGIDLDGAVVLPWNLDQFMIQDRTGNALGLVIENGGGGFRVTDPHTNVLFSSHPNPMGGQNIQGASTEQIATTVPNALGGSNIYDSEMSLDWITSDNVLNGEYIFQDDMQLIGMTSSLSDAMTIDISKKLPSIVGYDNLGLHSNAIEPVLDINDLFQSMEEEDVITDLLDQILG